MIYTLYYAPNTVALAVHIALLEAGCDFHAEPVDFSQQEQRSDSYLFVNPKGRVPALVTDRGVLTETPALLTYIAQEFPEARLVPKDPFAFAQTQAFNAYLCATVHVAHAHHFRAYRWADDPIAIEAMQQKVASNMRECFTLIEQEMLRCPWVMGDAFSICDPYLFTVTRWLAYDNIELSEFPRIQEHFWRLHARPATQAAMAAQGIS